MRPSQGCLGKVGSERPHVAVGSPQVLGGHWTKTYIISSLASCRRCPHGAAHNVARSMFSPGERVRERANRTEVTVCSKPSLESDCSHFAVFYSLEEDTRQREGLTQGVSTQRRDRRGPFWRRPPPNTQVRRPEMKMTVSEMSHALGWN